MSIREIVRLYSEVIQVCHMVGHFMSLLFYLADFYFEIYIQ